MGIVSKKSEHQLVESITNSVIEPGDDETIGKLVNVHEQLCLQNKLDEASVIAEMSTGLAALFSPGRDLESWQQLQDHEAVLIEGAVVTKTAAEIVMAGVAKKSTRFRNKLLTGTPMSGPVGEDLIPLEPPAIGDPDRVLEDSLRDLHRGAGLSGPVRKWWRCERQQQKDRANR